MKTDPNLASGPAGDEFHPHLVILAVCAAILIGGLIPARPGADTPHVTIGRAALPSTCIMRGTTGLPCPGCGLIRSCVSALDGDLAASFRYHRLGPLFLLYIALQTIHQLAWLTLPRWRAAGRTVGRRLNQGLALLGLLFALNWIPTIAAALRA